MPNSVRLLTTVTGSSRAILHTKDGGATYAAATLLTSGPDAGKYETLFTGLAAGSVPGGTFGHRFAGDPALAGLVNTAVVVNAAVPGAPVITSFTPLTATGGSPVTLTGTGFTGATGVRFGASTVSAVTVNSDTSASTSVPAGTAAALDGPLTLLTPNGNATSAASFALAAQPTGSVANIVATGNSIVQGGTPEQGPGFVAYLDTLLGAGYPVLNQGSSGQGIQYMEDTAAAADAAYDTTLPAGQNVLIAMEGTNSMAGANALSGADYFLRFKNYCLARKARGWRVIAITVPPKSTGDQAGIDFNGNALIVNNALLDPSNASAFSDVVNLGLNAKAGRFSPSSANDTANYYDGLHPTPLVHTIIGRMVYDSVQFVLNGTLKPDPSNYPPEAVLPGEFVTWAELDTAQTGTGSESSWVWNADGTGIPGCARSQQSFPAKSGLCAFVEMTLSAKPPGFFNLNKSFGAANTIGWIEQGMFFGGGGGNPVVMHIWSGGGKAGDAVTVVGPGDRVRMEAYADRMLFYRNGQQVFELMKTIEFPVHATCTLSPGGTTKDAALINVKIGAG